MNRLHARRLLRSAAFRVRDFGMAINVSHMVQEIAMELLSNAGFSVSLADDGDVAVETLRTAAPDQFDLVLMDIQMPKLDGYSATRQIRTPDGAIAKVLWLIPLSYLPEP